MMIVSTTQKLDGHPIQEYVGVVAGQAILGANALRNISASFSDIFGGRTTAYEEVIQQAREAAMAEAIAHAKELGANALVGVDIDYEAIDRSSGDGGSSSSMLMVSVSGTAVRVL